MKQILEGAEAWRAGKTATAIERADSAVRLSIRHPELNLHAGKSGVSLETQITSKGGGQTRVYIWIPAESFKQLAQAMMSADQDLSEIAFLQSMLSVRP